MKRYGIKNCKFRKESNLKKNTCDSFEQYMAKISQEEVTVISWLDNEIVNVAPTFAGANPLTAIKRTSRKLKNLLK